MAEAEGEAWAKDVLNDVAFEIISFLGTVQHVRDVRVKAKQPASAQLISNWERVRRAGCCSVCGCGGEWRV